MRYRINIHNHEGRTQRYEHVEAENYMEARLKGDRLLTVREHQQGWYVTADALPEPPADGICPRCGNSMAACGGPTDPHE